MNDLGDWWQERVYDVMDGLILAFGLGATAFVALLMAGAVILPVGLVWEMMNPNVAGHPDWLIWLAAALFGVCWLAAAGHSFRRFEGIRRG